MTATSSRTSEASGRPSASSCTSYTETPGTSFTTRTNSSASPGTSFTETSRTSITLPDPGQERDAELRKADPKLRKPNGNITSSEAICAASDSSAAQSGDLQQKLSYLHEPQSRGEMPQSRDPAGQGRERGDGLGADISDRSQRTSSDDGSRLGTVPGRASIYMGDVDEQAPPRVELRAPLGADATQDLHQDDRQRALEAGQYRAPGTAAPDQVPELEDGLAAHSEARAVPAVPEGQEQLLREEGDRSAKSSSDRRSSSKGPIS